MDIQVWHDEPALKLGGVAISSIGFWLTSDTTKDLPESFSLLINARVCGVQVGSVLIDPVKNSTFSMPLLASVGGTVEGRIDNWNALDNGRKPVDAAADPHWKSATEVTFLVTGLADVTISSNAILGLVPGLGWAVKAALAVLGDQVKISVAHEQVIAPLPHGTGTSPAAAQIPQLAPSSN